MSKANDTAVRSKPSMGRAAGVGTAVGIAISAAIGLHWGSRDLHDRAARRLSTPVAAALRPAQTPGAPTTTIVRLHTADEHPLATGWVRAPMDTVENAGYLHLADVDVEDGRIVAHGEEAVGCCDDVRLSWQSSDAGTWTPLQPPPELGGPLFTGARAFASGHGIRVAVGNAAPEPLPEHFDGDPTFAAAWFSTDGEHWKRAAGDEDVFGHGDRIDEVWVTSDGFAGLGTHHEADPLRSMAAVWTSAEGRVWSRVRGLDAPSGPGVQLSTGIFVLTPTAAWRSADGVHWTIVARFPESGYPAHTSPTNWVVLPLGDVVAALRDTPGGEELWLSHDGASWERIGQPFGPTGGVRRIRQTPFGYLALGGGSGSGVLWVSRDARSWYGVPDVEGAFSTGTLDDAVVFRDRLVVVGDVPAPAGGKPRFRAMAWVHRLCADVSSEDPLFEWPIC